LNKKHQYAAKKEICRFVRIVGGFVMIGSFNPKSPTFCLQQATPELKTFTDWYASLYACLCRYQFAKATNLATLSYNFCFGVFLSFFFLFQTMESSTYIISLGGRPFHPSISSSVHPSSSSRKKKMMGDFTVSEGHGYPLVDYNFSHGML
jgi:hypothetical protein